MYLCYQNLPGIYKPPVLSKLFIHRPVSTLISLLSKTSPTLTGSIRATACCPGRPIWDDPSPGGLGEAPRTYLLLLANPCPVNRCCLCTALLVCTKRTAASCFCLEVHAQSTAAAPAPPCYPSAHSKRAIQVHTQAHAIQVHNQECVIQVHTQSALSKCTLRTCYPSAHPSTCYPSAHSERVRERIQVHGILVHPSFLNCRGTSRCLAVGTSYSCTQQHSERAIQVHTQNVL